jgi:hypothetical protein
MRRSAGGHRIDRDFRHPRQATPARPFNLRAGSASASAVTLPAPRRDQGRRSYPDSLTRMRVVLPWISTPGSTVRPWRSRGQARPQDCRVPPADRRGNRQAVPWRRPSSLPSSASTRSDQHRGGPHPLTTAAHPPAGREPAGSRLASSRSRARSTARRASSPIDPWSRSRSNSLRWASITSRIIRR